MATIGLAAALWSAPAAFGQACPSCIPLTDLGPRLYQGFEGGLYPGGVNAPPPAHAEAAFEQARRIVPRDADGAPDFYGGKVGFISIGMSNTTQEFGAFERAADADMERNARIVIVNAAQGGQSADRIADPQAPYWETVRSLIRGAGLAPAQVQVAWIKQADAQPLPSFPEHALKLRQELGAIVRILKRMYPNLRLCYLSSRTYGGWSDNTLRNEPLSYETGFAVKWLIEDQIAGDPSLNFGARPGVPVVAPVLLWGPYLWANGLVPRSDGLVWERTDFEADGIHPSEQGERKVAGLLTRFLKRSPIAQRWYAPRRATRLVTLPATDDAFVAAAAPERNFGDAPVLQSGRTPDSPFATYLRFPRPPIDRPILHAKLSLVNAGAGGGAVNFAPRDAWSEDSITAASAPAVGPLVGAAPIERGVSTTSVGVTGAARHDGDGATSFAMAAPAVPARRFRSKEGGAAPRLVMTVLVRRPGDLNDDGVVDGGDLGPLLAAWGPCGSDDPCEADMTGDGAVDAADLGAALLVWDG